MFKLKPNPTFWTKADLSVPGEPEPAQIEVQFRHKSIPEINDYFARLPGRTDADALGEIIAGWRGVDDQFNDDSLAALLANYPASARELFEAYRRELLESRRKN